MLPRGMGRQAVTSTSRWPSPRTALTWTNHLRYFGPVHYAPASASEGAQPRVYSITVDQADRILVAVAVSDRETVILESTDHGASFQQVRRLSSRRLHRRAEPLDNERRRVPPAPLPGVGERRQPVRIGHPGVQPFAGRKVVVGDCAVRDSRRCRWHAAAAAFARDFPGVRVRGLRVADRPFGPDEHVAVVRQEELGRGRRRGTRRFP